MFSYTTVLSSCQEKRRRRNFTPTQVRYLEERFRKIPYPKSTDIQNTATELRLTERSVRVWYQNRRMKLKKQTSQLSQFYDHQHSKESINCLSFESHRERMHKRRAHLAFENIWHPYPSSHASDVSAGTCQPQCYHIHSRTRPPRSIHSDNFIERPHQAAPRVRGSIHQIRESPLEGWIGVWGTD